MQYNYLAKKDKFNLLKKDKEILYYNSNNVWYLKLELNISKVSFVSYNCTLENMIIN